MKNNKTEVGSAIVVITLLLTLAGVMAGMTLFSNTNTNPNTSNSNVVVYDSIKIEASDQTPGGCCAQPYYYEFDKTSLTGERKGTDEYVVKGNITLIDPVSSPGPFSLMASMFGKDGYRVGNIERTSDLTNATLVAGQPRSFTIVLKGDVEMIDSIVLGLSDTYTPAPVQH